MLRNSSKSLLSSKSLIEGPSLRNGLIREMQQVMGLLRYVSLCQAHGPGGTSNTQDSRITGTLYQEGLLGL